MWCQLWFTDSVFTQILFNCSISEFMYELDLFWVCVRVIDDANRANCSVHFSLLVASFLFCFYSTVLQYSFGVVFYDSLVAAMFLFRGMRNIRIRISTTNMNNSA